MWEIRVAVGNRKTKANLFERAVIGSKKSMCYKKKGYKQEHGHWLMKEYDLSPHILDKFDKDCRDFVLCAIKKKKSRPKGKLNIVGEQDQSSCEGLQVDAGELAFFSNQGTI